MMICKLLPSFNSKPFVVTTYAQKFYFNHWFYIKKKIKRFHFPHFKTNANYAEICKVRNVEADCQQAPLVQFSESVTIQL